MGKNANSKKIARIPVINDYIAYAYEKSRRRGDPEDTKEETPLKLQGKDGVYFNPATGRGYAYGKEFKFSINGKEYRIFSKLYENINKRIGRTTILELAHFYEEGEDPDPVRRIIETETINKITKNIRKKTGLDNKQLNINRGSLTLVGKKLEVSPI